MTKKPDGGMVRMNAILPSETYERLRKAAFDERRPMTEIIRVALDRYFKTGKGAKR